MGIKIKKEEKPQLQKLPRLKLKYTLAVPLIGLLDVLTMGSFFLNPATNGMPVMKGFFVICALIGAGFACWGLMWKTTVDGKRITVQPVLGAKKEVPFSDLKKAVVYKRKKNGSLICYELIDVRGDAIVKIYPLMKDSGELLERLKRLGIKLEEKSS